MQLEESNVAYVWVFCVWHSINLQNAVVFITQSHRCKHISNQNKLKIKQIPPPQLIILFAYHELDRIFLSKENFYIDI